MTTFTTRDIHPALRRKSRKTDWQAVKEEALLTMILVVVLLSVVLAFTVLIVVLAQEPPKYALDYPAQLNGEITTLGAICAKAASESALRGDLLTYCK